MNKQAECPLCNCESMTLRVQMDEHDNELPQTEVYTCLCCNIYWPTEMQWVH